MVHFLLVIIYITFISLGLPDAILGSAWPVMYEELGVSIGFAGVISTIIALGTVVSSLLCDRLIRRLGMGKLTAFSVGLTALALLGFAFCRNGWLLCLLAIPYGLGAGSVDTCLNNYVAVHCSSRHMSWTHCMWSLGAASGPYVMGFVFTAGQHWSKGYLYVGLFQALLFSVLLLSLPMWKKTEAEEAAAGKSMTFRQILAIPGAWQLFLAFFCYCAIEQVAGLWASSYLVLHRGVDEQTAAFFGSLYFVGITAGRVLNGFLTMKFSDTQLIRMGFAIIFVGILAMLLPLGQGIALAGLVLAGLGSAPIYPCIIHSTPDLFGEENSQALIGVEMASAYTGICVMPPLFGLVAKHISISLFPAFLLIMLALMALMHQWTVRKRK